MAALPPEYRAEPALALAGGDDGMDFVRRIVREAPAHMTDDGRAGARDRPRARALRARVPAPRGAPGSRPAPGDDQVLLITALSALAAPRCVPPMITLRERHRCAAAPSSCSTAPRSRSTPGEKVGLVGRNGAGKSSLFALLADRLHADAGDVDVPPRWRIGEVAQEMPETDDGATDFVLQGDTPLMRARGRAGARPRPATTATRWPTRTWRSSEAGAFDARAARAGAAARPGLQASTQLDAPVNSFSGGWRMRLQLARALMCPADLLLLDEPTNHLDLDALVWLEAWLQRYAGTMIVISHDREFLDAITRVTLHLDETKLDPLHRQLHRLRGDARRAHRRRQQAALREAAGAHRAPAALHRPLQGQGEQGQAGAEPRQGAGAHGEARAGADQRRLPVRVPRAAEPAEPDAAFARRRLRLPGEGGTRDAIVRRHRPLGARRPAHRHPRRQRPGQVDAGQDHRRRRCRRSAATIIDGKGLAIGYFAQQEIDVLLARRRRR